MALGRRAGAGSRGRPRRGGAPRVRGARARRQLRRAAGRGASAAGACARRRRRDDRAAARGGGRDPVGLARPARSSDALTDLASAERRAGRRAKARDTAARAQELATSCGATILAARALDEAVAAGARPRRVALRGVDSLTPSELRVAQRAAAGNTNREIAEDLFVTIKIVEMHLANAYGKLGIRSCTQLPEALGNNVDLSRRRSRADLPKTLRPSRSARTASARRRSRTPRSSASTSLGAPSTRPACATGRCRRRTSRPASSRRARPARAGRRGLPGLKGPPDPRGPPGQPGRAASSRR